MIMYGGYRIFTMWYYDHGSSRRVQADSFMLGPSPVIGFEVCYANGIGACASQSNRIWFWAPDD